MWGIHKVHCTWSASMYLRNKTLLVFYQKGQDGVGQYSMGLGVYVMAAIFQSIIKLVEKWLTNISPSTICIMILALSQLSHIFSTLSPQSSATWDWSCLVTFISLQVTSLPSDVVSMLMRLKLSNSFDAICFCLPSRPVIMPILSPVFSSVLPLQSPCRKLLKNTKELGQEERECGLKYSTQGYDNTTWGYY